MRRVIVFGATSAIAAAVAARWSARGDRLHLVGRDPGTLAALASTCPRATPTVADLCDLDRAEDLFTRAVAELGGVDLVFIAHGDLGDQLRSEHEFAEAEHILRTNLLSAVALLVPAASHLERQRGGQLAVITSVAGDRGRPRNYTYGAAKGALNLYLQGLRSRLYPSGVAVTTLKLGPVDTPMTASHRKSALFATTDRVAADIVRAIDRRAGEVYVPWWWRTIMRVVRAAPEPLFQRLRALSGR